MKQHGNQDDGAQQLCALVLFILPILVGLALSGEAFQALFQIATTPVNEFSVLATMGALFQIMRNASIGLVVGLIFWLTIKRLPKINLKS